MGKRKAAKPVIEIKKRRKAKRQGGVLTAKTIALLERRYKVVTMRRDGYTLQEIGAELNISVSTAAEDLRKLMEETVRVTEETTEEARALQAMRLDSIVKGHMPFATQTHRVPVTDKVTGQTIAIEVAPNPANAQILLQAEQRRSKLLGLDKPEEKHLKVSGVREYIGVDLDQV